MHRNVSFLLLTALLAGCVSAPKEYLPAVAGSFPADAVITQRGLFTAHDRHFTLNGYLALSAQGGKRLILTENFGGVLADVLITPGGAVRVLRSSAVLKPEWIKRYVAADLECIFGNTPRTDCPGRQISPTHFVIERPWYRLDLQIVEIKPGAQPPAMFAPPAPATP